MIYLDNAATSWPKPEIVYKTMDRFLREKGGNPGHGSHSLAMAAKHTIDETRALVARFINAPDNKRIIFTLNCTESINLGLKGLLKPGDHVITSSLEHNAVVRPLWKLEQSGIKVTYLRASEKTGITSPSDVEAAIIPKTRMIAMIHASNVNGVVQPIAEYGKIVRKHNLVFLVDAAQSAGHFPIDVQSDNIDLLAFSAHKGPLGAPGVGVLYLSPKANPDTLTEGGTGSVSNSPEQPQTLPDKYESGTMNGSGISALGAGLQFIFSEGLDRIHDRELSLTRTLMDGLTALPRIRLYLTGDEARRVPVVSFNIDDYEPEEVAVILDQAFDIKARSGLHCSPMAHKTMGTYPKGTVRLSPGYFNTLEEIKLTIQAIKQIAGSKKKSF
jgi:cysteine desulfurase family protein